MTCPNCTCWKCAQDRLDHQFAAREAQAKLDINWYESLIREQVEIKQELEKLKGEISHIYRTYFLHWQRDTNK